MRLDSWLLDLLVPVSELVLAASITAPTVGSILPHLLQTHVASGPGILFQAG